MANNDNSSNVAVVAIVILVIVALGVFYYLSNGFQFNKAATPTSVTNVIQPSAPTGGATGTTGETKK